MNRSVRPHVLVTVPAPVVADRDGAGRGVAETAWSGPLPWREVRRLLGDADVSRVLIDADSLPLEAGAGVRTVPAGLWKALLVRDVTCIADGCTTPAAWCDVMHLDVPYRLEGRLTLATAGLGCRYHHRRFDHGGWHVTWLGRRPVLHHPSRRPSGPAPRSTAEPTVDPDPSVDVAPSTSGSTVVERRVTSPTVTDAAGPADRPAAARRAGDRHDGGRGGHRGASGPPAWPVSRPTTGPSP